MEEMPEMEKGRARHPWLVIGSIIAVLLIVIGVLICMDDAPPDDAWLLPEIKPEPADKNPLVLFCETIEAHPIEKDYLDLMKAVKDFKNISTDDMRAFVDKHPLQSEAFDKLLQTHSANWHWPGLTQNVYSGTSLKYALESQHVTNGLPRMKTELYVRMGKGDEAAEEALKTTRFGHGISGSEGFLIPWLVGITCQSIGERSLRSALTLPGIVEETLRRTQEAMTPLDPGIGQLRQILPWEYLSFKNTLTKIKTGTSAPSLFYTTQTTLIQLFLRKNRTLSNYLALMRPVYDATEKDWPALLTAVHEQQRILEEWQKNWFRFTLNPNVGGNILLEMTVPIFVKLCERSAASSALHRQAVIMIALRRCELAEGKLPEKLDALVPRYLPAVPPDPFDSAPMRWDCATGALYSIGANFKDDHGSFSEPYKSADKDVGMHYWWKPKAP